MSNASPKKHVKVTKFLIVVLWKTATHLPPLHHSSTTSFLLSFYPFTDIYHVSTSPTWSTTVFSLPSALLLPLFYNLHHHTCTLLVYHPIQSLIYHLFYHSPSHHHSLTDIFPFPSHVHLSSYSTTLFHSTQPLYQFIFRTTSPTCSPPHLPPHLPSPFTTHLPPHHNDPSYNSHHK